MGKGGFAEWAHYQGLGAGAALLCGGPICFFYPLWYLGPYGLVVGFLVMAMEWPILSITSILGILYSNFMVRGIIYLVLSVACYLQACLLNSGQFLSFCGITYIIAHLQGEKLKSNKKKQSGQVQGDKR